MIAHRLWGTRDRRFTGNRLKVCSARRIWCRQVGSATVLVMKGLLSGGEVKAVGQERVSGGTIGVLTDKDT